MRRAADWVAEQFRRAGFRPNDRDRGPSAGLRRVAAGDGAPTVLVYGHYDVQPADPLEQWTSPPFEPTRRDGNLYARGATDDKGQMLTHVKSVEAWLAVEGRLPVNLKFLIEGEEEVGSAAWKSSSPKTPSGWPATAWWSATTCQFAPGPAGHHLRAAGHRLLRTAADRARTAICTPARSAARSPTRPTRWRKCWPP